MLNWNNGDIGFEWETKAPFSEADLQREFSKCWHISSEPEPVVKAVCIPGSNNNWVLEEEFISYFIYRIVKRQTPFGELKIFKSKSTDNFDSYIIDSLPNQVSRVLQNNVYIKASRSSQGIEDGFQSQKQIRLGRHFSNELKARKDIEVIC